MTTTPYVSIGDADAYFDERLNSGVWEDASDDDKLKSLKMATRSINNLQYLGVKADSSQENEFPRGGQTDVPQEVKDATCEIALSLLDDYDSEMEIRGLPVKQALLSGARAEWERDFALTHIRNGIPSSEAWARLLPYLVDPLRLSLRR